MARKRKPVQPVKDDTADEGEEIPMEEQIRLIEQSGVLQLQESENTQQEAPEGRIRLTEKMSLVEEIFDCIILLIPFSCLYIGMDVYVCISVLVTTKY